MSLMMLQMDEEERQVVILALAELALSRPGWDHMLRHIVERIDAPGLAMFEQLKSSNADRVQAERGPMPPLVAQQDEEEIQRWIYGVENGAPMPAGDFLRTIVAAALRADYENYPLMRPLIIALKQKFPKYKFEGTLPQGKL